MNVFRVCAAAVISLSVAGCISHDVDGTGITPDAIAALRYINLVPDTGALNFRIVDIINNAPNSIGATFRTGGNPYGSGTTLPPPYFPVDAGTRHIKVFLNSSVDSLATQVLLDTTVTFVENSNYTFYLYGYARTGSTPKISALVTKDDIPTIPAGQFAIRVIHLAPTMTGTPTGLATTTADVFVDTLAAGATPVGTPTFAAVAYGEVRPYAFKAVRVAVAGPPAVPALNYRAAFSATTTFTPFFQVDVPTGVVGTSLVNPIAGELVAGTAYTVLLAPRSVAGSAAPQTAAFTAPGAIVLVDQQPARTAP